MSHKLHQRIRRLEQSDNLSPVPAISEDDLIAYAQDIMALGREGIEPTPQLSSGQIYGMAQEFLL